MRLLFIALLLVASVSTARDMSERRAFIRENPKPDGCDRCEVDHRKALMNGGDDKRDNMRWMSHDEHKEKTKEDHKERKGRK